MDEQVDIPQQEDQQQPQGQDTPTLPPEKRKELHGIITKMVLNRESEDNIKLVIDHYTKKNVQAPAPSQSAPETPKSRFSIQDKPYNFLQYPSIEEAQQQLHERHQKELSDADQTVNKHLEQSQAEAAQLLKRNESKADQARYANTNAYLSGNFVPEPDKNFNVEPTPEQVHATIANPDNHAALIDLKAQNLENAGKKKDANKLRADAYLLTSANRGGNTAKQLDNAQKIKDGEVEYNPVKDELVKPLSFGEGVHEAWKKRDEDMQLFDLADNGTDQQLIQKLNSLQQKDPDEPVPAPGAVGEFVGSQGKVTGEMVAANILLNEIPVVGQKAAEAVSGGLYAHEFGRRGYVNELQKSYLANKQAGLSDEESLDRAKSQAKTAMVTDAATAALMGVGTGKAGGKLFRNTAENAVKIASEGGWYNGVIKSAYRHIGEEAPAAIKNASLAAGGEVAKNISANQHGENRDILEGSGGAALNMAALHYVTSSALAVLGKVMNSDKSGSKKITNELLQGASKLPIEDIKNISIEQIKDGIVTPQEAQTNIEAIEAHKEIDAQIPKSVVNDKVRLELQDIVRKREATAEEKSKVSAAFAEPFKLKIEKYDEKINELANSPEAKQETPDPEPEKPRVTVSTPNIVNIKLKEPVAEAEVVPQDVSSAEESPQSNGNTVGIAHESKNSRASKLGQPEQERGEGVSIQQSVDHGRSLLKDGGDPAEALAQFQKDKKISYDNISLVRAHLEKLAKTTNKAVEEHGLGSPQAEEAKAAEMDWRKQISPMQTEWSKIGTAQQGETDIDTGTVMGLQRAYTEKTGRAFSPKQEAEAKEHVKIIAEKDKQIEQLHKQLDEAHVKNEQSETKNIKQRAKQIADTIRKGKLSRPDSFSAATPASLVWDSALEVSAKVVEASGNIAQAVADGIEHIKGTEWYKGLSEDKQKNAINAFTEHIEKSKEEPKELKERFVDKTDSKFSPQDAKDIWSYAKEKYLDKGEPYSKTVANVANDLGLSSEQVRRAFTLPKGAREISDQIYTQTQNRNNAINNAKAWVKKEDSPAAVKFAKALPGFFFGLKVFGHGTVGMVTHAGTNIFRPSQWGLYWKNFGRQFKFFSAFGPKGEARYAKAMEDLKNDPQFTFWKRAGLAVDPKEVYDEYQGASKGIEKLTNQNTVLGKLIRGGDRGFNALKTYRLDLAKDFYKNLSDKEKNDPNTAKEIANIVNHTTGTANLNIGNGRVASVVNTMFFAPKLEASRWHKLLLDPAKAVKTGLTWGKSTPADRVQAKIVARKAGELMATYGVGLAANAGFLAAAGSTQKINFTDPTKSDFLKFKGFGRTLDVTGGMLASMRLIGALADEADKAYTGSKADLREKPQDKDFKTIGQQARYKLSPFASFVTDWATGSDAMGRPLPGSKIKPQPGVTPYTPLTYVSEQLLPIPWTEGVRATMESMHERGMAKKDIADILIGIGTGAVSGGTGAKVGQDFSLKPKKTSGRSGRNTSRK